MRIAIVGTGIAGLSAAWTLHRAGHDLTLFEAGGHVGGHVNTVPIEAGGRTWPVDTGFIVFNDWTYPNFLNLLKTLGVERRPTDMGFSVRDEATGIEYNGRNLNTLFAQRRNLLRPSHWRMIGDILRFAREAETVLADATDPTLGEVLDRGRYSAAFRERYLVPMGAAIWSAPAAAVLRMPARFFVNFFRNHGMLSVDDRPQWYTVVGGSWAYVRAMAAPFQDRIRLRTPVHGIRRLPDGIALRHAGGTETFDEVVIASHSDQALALLEDPSAEERAVLGALRYQPNEAILHSDEAVLPRRRSCWAAWNYHLLADRGEQPVPVTYHMNLLQGFSDAPQSFLVTLNHDGGIDPRRIIARIPYHHPIFDPPAVRAQARWGEINGVRRTWFCGAYWRNGFHEDGLVSGLRVARGLGAEAPWQADLGDAHQDRSSRA